MAVIPLKCPHCLAMTNLRVIGYALSPAPAGKHLPPFVSIGSECPGCHRPVGVLAKPTNGTESLEHLSRLQKMMEKLVPGPSTISETGLTFVEAWPKAPEPNIPEHLPEITAKAFLQAENNYPIVGHEEAAGMMYRRALETGLAKAYPKMKGTLAQNIKQLVNDKVLTEEIGTWATQIRLIGNEGAHGEEITREDLAMARAFADAALRYIFTLPEQVKLRSQPASST